MNGRRAPQRRRLLAEGAPTWPQRGDLAHDSNRDRIGVITETPNDTGTTFYRLTPEGGGDGWGAPLNALSPVDEPQPLPFREPGGTLLCEGQPEDAPWDGLGSPGPSPALRTRAAAGLERFLRRADEVEQ